MSEPLFLILSGTYVGPELVSEFGQLPPCFLPNGTQRLIEQQIAFAQTLCPAIALLLPTGFKVPHYDAEKLRAADVRLLHCDDDRTIPEGLAETLATLDHDGRLFLLLGDTPRRKGVRAGQLRVGLDPAPRQMGRLRRAGRRGGVS